MHIGLIGGIGPSATISYYKRLIEEFRKADLPLKLTIEHADMNVLLRNASKDQRTTQADVFAKHLENLAAAGCDIALITALTGHFCFAETRGISPITLVDGTGIIDRYCHENGIKTLGILGSTSVLKTKLFGLLRVPEIVVPRAGLDELGATYMELAQTGVCTMEQRSMFFEAGASMVKDQHVEAVLLAGTDLGLAFNHQTHGFRVIDAVELHVKELVSLVANEYV
jgi:aspartate racemase